MLLKKGMHKYFLFDKCLSIASSLCLVAVSLFSLQTLARCLIMWDEIVPNADWVTSNVPQVCQSSNKSNIFVLFPTSFSKEEAHFCLRSWFYFLIPCKFTGWTNIQQRLCCEKRNCLVTSAIMVVSRSLSKRRGRLLRCFKVCLLIMRYIHNAAGVAVYPVCLELYSICFRKSPRSPAT